MVRQLPNIGATRLYIPTDNLGKYDEAIQAYDEVIRLDPNNAEAYFYLGQARVGAGDIIGGCGDFAKAKILGYKKAEEESNKYCIK